MLALHELTLYVRSPEPSSRGFFPRVVKSPAVCSGTVPIPGPSPVTPDPNAVAGFRADPRGQAPGHQQPDQVTSAPPR